MTLEYYIDRINGSDNHIVEFTPEELAEMDSAVADNLIHGFGSHIFTKLAPAEITFMEWLRVNAPGVWTDLWGSEESLDAEHQPYVVSLAYLKNACGPKATNEYHICDLQTEPNYYFVPEMLFDKEAAPLLDAVRSRFNARESITPAQLLALEASAGPVDIWHFSYRHGIALDRAKRAVEELVEDHMIVHVPLSEHLAQFFDV